VCVCVCVCVCGCVCAWVKAVKRGHLYQYTPFNCGRASKRGRPRLKKKSKLAFMVPYRPNEIKITQIYARARLIVEVHLMSVSPFNS